MLQEVFRDTVFVWKKEIKYIPFFGWALASIPMIETDRSATKAALKSLVDQGRDRLASGYTVVIFPEGTRSKPGSKNRYKVGGAHLAVETGALVVPVALNSGEFWGRNALFKKCGTVTVSVGPASTPQGCAAERGAGARRNLDRGRNGPHQPAPVRSDAMSQPPQSAVRAPARRRPARPGGCLARRRHARLPRRQAAPAARHRTARCHAQWRHAVAAAAATGQPAPDPGPRRSLAARGGHAAAATGDRGEVRRTSAASAQNFAPRLALSFAARGHWVEAPGDRIAALQLAADPAAAARHRASHRARHRRPAAGAGRVRPVRHAHGLPAEHRCSANNSSCSACPHLRPRRERAIS
jgi:1-acyl-sn-glycerol-3-phosphate acyltransferase